MVEESLTFNNVLFNENCRCWFRFLEDVFAIWEDDLNTLSLFITYINYLIPGLEFIMTYNQEKMSFFDTCVSMVNGKLSSDLYTKPANCNHLFAFQ